MRRISRAMVWLSLAMLASLLVPTLGSAHEGREVANGQYELVVGFLDEPAFVGEKNAMIVQVSKAAAAPAGTPESESEESEDSATAVEGLAETLQAEVIYGDQRMTLQIRPLFGQPGSYVGYFFPMAEGDYSFRVFGEIEGNPIDETFTAGPETFAAVESRAAFEFPKLDS